MDQFQFDHNKAEGTGNAVDVLIGAAIYERRLKINMLLEDLSIATCLERDELDAYEKGLLRIPAENLVAICRALEISPANLFIKLRS